jgi:hypothetical protein
VVEVNNLVTNVEIGFLLPTERILHFANVAARMAGGIVSISQ